MGEPNRAQSITSGADDLAAFLLARYDELEQAVRRLLAYSWEAYATGLPPDHWTVARRGEDRWEVEATAAPHLRRKVVVTLNAWALLAQPFMKHLERYDPAAVLADVASKRAIAEQYRHKAESMRLYPNPGNAAGLIALTEVLRLLALPFAGHEDYRAEWAAE